MREASVGDRKKLRVAGVVGRDRGQIWVLRRLSCGGAEVEAREEATTEAGEAGEGMRGDGAPGWGWVTP